MTSYKKYRDNMVKTGAKTGRLPKFHDEIHKFVQYRHIFNPIAVQSFGLEKCAGTSNVEIVDESDSSSENLVESLHITETVPPPKKRKRLRPPSKFDILSRKIDNMESKLIETTEALKKHNEILEKNVTDGKN